jgi:twinkle protein
MVLSLERNQQADDPNRTTIRVLKNRFTGETGTCGHLIYNPETGRLLEDVNDDY